MTKTNKKNTKQTKLNAPFFATLSDGKKAQYESSDTIQGLVDICKDEKYKGLNIEITDRFGVFVSYIHHTQH